MRQPTGTLPIAVGTGELLVLARFHRGAEEVHESDESLSAHWGEGGNEVENAPDMRTPQEGIVRTYVPAGGRQGPGGSGTRALDVAGHRHRRGGEETEDGGGVRAAGEAAAQLSHRG